MPGCGGIEVAASLPSPRPRIIFCTAYDQYAVEAFKPSAAKIVSWWIHCYILERRGRDVRYLLQKYGHLYSRYYRVTMFIKSLFPRTGVFYDTMKLKIHSLVRPAGGG